MITESNPLVSVLMTAYNREQYIAEAIESVLASSYTNFELIIVDDCSTDNTAVIAKEYASKDSRIKVFVNEHNLKDYPNRNKGASYAKGKYIKYLDSDDAIFSEGLEYCVRSMENYPDAGIGMQFFQNEYIDKVPLCWSSNKIIRHHFFVKGCLNIGPSGSIFKRDVFEVLGGFDTRFGVASDNFFNIRLAATYPVVLLPQQFFFYRIHEGQEFKDKIGYLKYNHLYLKALVENVDLPISVNEKEKLKKRLQKSFAIELIRHFLKTRRLSSVHSLMIGTQYSLKDMIRGLFQ